MARRVEEIKRVRRDVTTDQRDNRVADDSAEYQEEYYDVGDNVSESSGLDTASGVLALLLLALAIYLVWAVLR